MAAKRVWTGAKQLRGFLVPIGRLKRDPNNARMHGEENLAAIRRSLLAFGQLKPVVSRQGIIIAGNGLHEVAKALGFTHIARVEADALTDEQATAFGIADNRTGELSDWRPDILIESLVSLPENLRTVIGEIDLAKIEEPEAPKGRSKDSDSDGHPVTVTFSTEQWQTVARAIAKARDGDTSGDAPNGRWIELICADWLS